MGVAKRFSKRNVEIKSCDEKATALDSKKFSKVRKRPDEGPVSVVDLKSIPKNSPHLESNILNKKLQCYHKVNELFQNNSLSMFNLIKGVLEITCFGVDAEGGSLWIVEDKKISCKVANGPGSEKIIGLSLDIGQGIAGWVVEHNKTQIVYDTKHDLRFDNKNDPTKTLIAAPLVYNSEVIGVVEVVNKKNIDEKYDDDDKLFLEDLSTTIASHIKTTRLLKEQNKLISQMQNFSEIHDSFSSTIDLDKLLVMVLKKAIRLINAEVGSIWLVEENGEGIQCSYAVGPTKDKVEGIKLKKGVGVIGKVCEEKRGLIIEDCRENADFSNLVDSKINFQTLSMICSPFVVKGECIGAIQIINKKGNQFFSEEDLKLIELFGSSAAMYIKNAKLFASEKKAKDLSALIDIGKNITSTLDLDAVLVSIVNLSSRILPFDESQISVTKVGSSEKLSLRAISGQQEVDSSEIKNKMMEEIHNSIIKKDLDVVYVPSLDEFEEDKLPQIIKKYMEDYSINSFWAKSLKDDQGTVGVYSFESEDKYLVSTEYNEILDILTAQSTVALRNVDLYNTIPSSQYVKSLKDNFVNQIKNFKEIPSRKIQQFVAGIIISVLCLVFIKVPYNVAANIEILPRQKIHFSQVQSTVKKVYVKEGHHVKKGELLVELDTSDSKIQLLDKRSKLQKAKTEMFKMLEERNIADYKIKESEYLSLDSEIELLEKKIAMSRIIATEDGVIISEKLEELVGKPVNFGEELVKLADVNNLIVQFEVPENSVQYVRSKQEVKFKVYGQPNSSFSNGIKLLSVAGEGRQLIESDPNKYYMAKAIVDNKNIDNKLRPGMTGRGKIYTEWQPIGHLLFGRLYNFMVMEIFF